MMPYVSITWAACSFLLMGIVAWLSGRLARAMRDEASNRLELELAYRRIASLAAEAYRCLDDDGPTIPLHPNDIPKGRA